MTNKAVLLSENDNGVMLLTLNRPEARNALNIELTRALREHLTAYLNDDSLHIAILTGAGPGFCAGLDLNGFAAPDAPRVEVGELIHWIAGLSKPVIAALNGAAVTGGLELALACDFIIASDRARFADTHTRIGALSGSGMSSRLPHAVGTRWAKQITMSCEPITADTALRIGLVNEVLPHDELFPRARAIAHTIAGHDPELVKTVKGTLDKGAHATLAESLVLERDALAARKAKGGMSWRT